MGDGLTDMLEFVKEYLPQRLTPEQQEWAATHPKEVLRLLAGLIKVEANPEYVRRIKP